MGHIKIIELDAELSKEIQIEFSGVVKGFKILVN
jgi:hypothetical protein